MEPKNIKFSLPAKHDLKQIWRYSQQSWSAARADIYSNKLKSCIQALAQWPNRGLVWHENKREIRYSVCGRHMIFFEVYQAHITIVRILHQSMDYEKHLS